MNTRLPRLRRPPEIAFADVKDYQKGAAD